ncbi:MAG: NAD(P)H-dependent glycerol-3-phosphate dehydrogenase [Thermodesulfovibrionales bacterium]|nr:NAD(P)H-dependent glycerol-3-phosphate dehydrogenase [Thermodesulfovibrionales bacterium]
MNYPNSYISVIGAGAWGTTLAALLSEKGYDVTLWTYESELSEHINRERINHIYLPDVVLPVNLKATDDLIRAVARSRYILNAVPTQHIRSVFSQIKSYVREEAVIISVSKGIEINTLFTPSAILKEIINRPVAVLSGPSFAKEVAAKLPTAITLASDDKKTGLLLQEIFNTDYFRVYTHDDMIGSEIGGALKNVIAIAAGICNGLGLGHNAKAALITRGLSEITRLGIRMHAKEITFSGLSGLGDLVLTCTAPLSRNYTVGYKLGQGVTLPDITGKTRAVAEGISTTLSAFELSKKHNIDMPITEQVYLTLYKNKAPEKAAMDLMNRSLKSEFHGH